MANKRLLIEYQIDFNRRRYSPRRENYDTTTESLEGSISGSQKNISLHAKAKQSNLIESLTTPVVKKEPSDRPFSPAVLQSTPKSLGVSYELRSLKSKPTPTRNGLGTATYNSFLRASNGMYRDIDRFLKKDYHPITQPSWDERFVYEKPLQPPLKTPNSSPSKRKINESGLDQKN
eukprot:gene13604-14988_t